MPTAPVYGNQNAQSRVVPGVFKQPNRTAADYGATDVLGKMAQVAENVYIKESDQRAEDAANTANFQKQEVATRIKAENPGVKAIGADALIRDAFAKIDNETLSGLQGNPRAVASYQKSAKLTDAAMQPQITGWMLSERDKAATATDKAAFERYTSEAVRLAPMSTVDLVSGVAYMAAMAQAKMAQMSLLNRVGASKETIEQANSELDGKVNAQVVAIFIDIQDFGKASSWFNGTKHLMDPATASKLEGDIMRGSTKNSGEAFGVAVASKYIKEDARNPNTEAAFNDILDSNMSPAEKRVAWAASASTFSDRANAIKSSSGAIARRLISEGDTLNKIGEARAVDDTAGRLLRMQDIVSRREWNDLTEEDKKAVEQATLHPPRARVQNLVYGVLDEQIKKGEPLDAAVMALATPEIREHFRQAEAARQNDVAKKQYDDVSSIAKSVMAKYSTSLGKDENKYREYEARLIGMIQASPDFGAELMKNQSLALKTAKDLVDAGNAKVPRLHPRYADRNAEIIKADMASGDDAALKEHAYTIITWGSAYTDPEARKQLIDAHMAMLAQGSGRQWSDWQNDARKELGFKAPQVIDSRATDLMMAAITEANRLRLGPDTVTTILDSWYNPITGPSNLAGSFIKNRVTDTAIPAARAVVKEARRASPAIEGLFQFGSAVEYDMWRLENALTSARKAAGKTVGGVFDYMFK